MSLGLNTEYADGDFLPIVKYDARAGRWTKRDRDESGNVAETDVTSSFAAIFDFENIEVGFIDFSGSPPGFELNPLAQGLPAKPLGDRKWKQGFRLHVMLANNIGGDAREFASTATCVIRIIDQLHTEYLAAPEKLEGKLPVVQMVGANAVQTGSSKNYEPELQIVSWQPRPEQLKAPAAKPDAAPQSGPASTGSTALPAPTPAAPAPVADLAFG